RDTLSQKEMKLQKYLLRNTCNGNLLNFFLLLLLYVPSVLTCPRNNNNNNNRPREYEGRIFIASPKKLSLDRNERISVIAYNVPDNEVMDVTIKDFPGMTKIFSSKRVSLKNGVPVFMDFNLPSNEILKYMETNIFGILYLNVYVEAKIGNKFESIMKVPVAYSKGYVFLQTDKPIYNPQQTVQIRIIALNEKLLPENNEVRVQIKNPQNIIVQETLFREPWKQSSGQFPKMNFTFPPFSMLGQWRIEASYGIRFQRQTSVSFHVEEYTLPTFAVKLRVPSAILSKDEKIDITVQAELTSFVMKLFCQASKLIYVDENVICKGMQWIISNQNSDGSFEDPYPVIRRDIMHGSDGKVPMTAFVLTVLQQCKCSSVNINNARLKAKSFLEKQFESINDSYVMALTAYALAATNSQNKHQANEKLLKMSTFDEELNQRYWAKSSKTESIEITSYSLLTQLELTNMSTSLSIVNWLNTQRLDGGYFPSSQ
ncbi:complement C3-like, partial [Centruroides sculpturatus]|uniref:complement C3-like n=1 Tax=Centruroides sculpturatus TaxID=218467 RepID=UPI000C6E811D